MAIARRRFLQAPALLAGFGWFTGLLSGCEESSSPSGGGEDTAGEGAPVFPSLDGDLREEKFHALYNETFHLYRADGSVVDVRLAHIETHPITRELEQFSVLFACEPAFGLGAGTYAVEHYAAGQTNLYVEPVSHPNIGDCLAADFSLLL